MLPEESAQVYFDLKAKSYFPVHWGMFELAFHTWYEPIMKISQAAKERGINLISPKLGETVAISDKYVAYAWWDEVSMKAEPQALATQIDIQSAE